MGKIVVSEFVTLDGVFEDPGGSEGTKFGGWQIPLMGEDAGQYKFEELQAADALLLGWVTYQGFAEAWPKMEKETGEFGKLMNSLPKYVVLDSSGQPQLSWNNSHLIRGDAAEEIRKLKQTVNKNILVGGSGILVRFLMEHGLVDEYRIMVHPVVLGTGRRLFDGALKTDLRLISTKTFSTGIVVLEYEPAKKAA